MRRKTKYYVKDKKRVKQKEEKNNQVSRCTMQV